MARLIVRDHYVSDPLDRITELEEKVATLERRVATLLRILDSGTSGATEQAWIEVTDTAGDVGYVHVYAAK